MLWSRVYTVQRVRTLHYSTFIEPQRQTWRSPRQGRQRDERGRVRVSQRLPDWADLETGKWRVSLTQHWLLTHKANTTGRLSVTGQVLPSRLLFIVECLLLSTVLFASLSLSLSSVWSCCADVQPLTLSTMGRTQRLAATPSIRLDAVAVKFT